MDFGFALLHQLRVDELRQLAQVGESLGFDHAWLPDQTFFHDPFLVLGLVAESTSEIQLGVGVTNPYTRHPVQIARSMATLNQAFPGRFTLGIGAGNRKELIEPLGRKQTRPARACSDALEIIRNLLGGRTVTHHGDFFSIDNVTLESELAPAPPLFLAGRGPATLRAAGRVADGAIVGGLVSPTGLDFAFENIHVGRSQAEGDLRPPYIVSWVTCRLTDEVEQAMARAKPVIAHIIGGAPATILKALQIDPDRLAKLKEAYEIGGPVAAADYVTETEVDMFSLIGDADRIILRLKDLESRGVNQFSMLLWGETLEEATATLKMFSRDVISELR